MRRTWLCLAALLAACGAEDAMAPGDGLLTLDTHIDIPRDWETPGNPSAGPGEHQATLDKMRAGGLDAAFFIAYAEQRPLTPEGYDQARRDTLGRIFAIHRMVEAHSDKVALALSADDIERIVASGRIAALIGLENAFPIAQDLDWLRLMYEGGVRYASFSHFGHSQLGDSSNPREDLGDAQTRHGGLSDFGRQALAEMNRLGILPDVSHTAHSTTMEVARLSKAPIIASHSGVRALADVERNLSDEALRAIRDNGGVAHIVALGAYVKKRTEEQQAERAAVDARFGIENPWTDVDRLSPEDAAARTAAMDEIDARYGLATVSDYVDHIVHAVEVAGIDHVGIASDFGGGGGIVGWDDASQTANVTAELRARGFTDAEIAKIWSGNLLRALRQAEQVARDLQGD